MSEIKLDEAVKYPYLVKLKLAKHKPIIELIADNQLDSVDDENVKSIIDQSIFDYDYVEGITQTTKSFICIDTIIQIPSNSATIKDVYISIIVGVNNGIMKINPKIFRGILGNRRDNLVREINNAICGDDDFGIGYLTLVDVKPYVVHQDFPCKRMIYKVPNFANGGMN